MTEVYVSVGSNLDSERNIAKGLAMLESRVGSLERSTIYEAESVGFSGPNFLNLVVRFESELPLPELVQMLRDIERACGRVHGEKEFDDRTLDLDIVLFGDLVEHSEHVDIPRADILHYAFVLCPLAEIAGEKLHPEQGLSFADLWDASDLNQALWPVQQRDLPRAAGRS